MNRYIKAFFEGVFCGAYGTLAAIPFILTAFSYGYSREAVQIIFLIVSLPVAITLFLNNKIDEIKELRK